MSRIGKKPIEIPEKVKAQLKEGVVNVSGPIGNLHLAIPSILSIELGDKLMTVKRSNDERQTMALHGLYRSLLANMVHGAAMGYQKILEIVGVGYKAEAKGKNVELALGFSHPVIFPIPEGIKVTIDKGVRITISGADKQLVGEIASRIRRIRPPEPYKGKGVRYSDEVVKKKVGKAAAAVGGGGK